MIFFFLRFYVFGWGPCKRKKRHINKRKATRHSLTCILPIYMGDSPGEMSNSARDGLGVRLKYRLRHKSQRQDGVWGDQLHGGDEEN